MTEEQTVIIKEKLLTLKNKKVTATGNDSIFEIRFGNIILTVNCFYRLYLGDKILSSSDFPKEVKMIGLAVNKIFVDEYCDYGDFTLELSNSAKLEVIADSSYDEPVWSLDDFVMTPYQIIGGEDDG